MRIATALCAPTSCLGCCSLRVGVLLLALLCLVNALLGFAGLRALVVDVESLAGMSGSALLPPGVELSDERLQGLVYTISFYFLTLFGAGCHSALARSALSAALLYGLVLVLGAAAAAVIVAAVAMGAHSVAIMYAGVLVPLIYGAALTRSWTRLLLGARGYAHTPDFGADVV